MNGNVDERIYLIFLMFLVNVYCPSRGPSLPCNSTQETIWVVKSIRNDLDYTRTKLASKKFNRLIEICRLRLIICNTIIVLNLNSCVVSLIWMSFDRVCTSNDQRRHHSQ